MSADARTLRNFAGLAAGEAVARGLAFVASLLIARRLGPAMYGVIGVASGIMLYLNQLADGGVELSGVPAVARQREGLSSLVSATLTVRVMIALALTAVVGLVGILLFPQPDGAILALYAMGLVFVALGTRWVFVGLQQTHWVAKARIAGEVTALAIVVIAVHDVGDVATVPIAALFGGLVMAVVMMSGLRSLGIRPVIRHDWPASRPIFERSPHLVTFTLLGLVLFNADLIYLRFISGQSAAGYYAAAYTFIAFAANLSIAWAQSALPTMSQLERDDPHRDVVYQNVMLLAYVVTLPAAVGGVMTAESFVQLVFGAEFVPAVAALIVLLPVVPIAAVREVAVTGLIATPNGERRMIWINVTCAVLNVAMLIPVVPRWGLIGAAAVTLATEVFRLVFALWLAREARFSIPAPGRLVRPTIAAAAMVPALVWVRNLPFAAQVVTGAIIYTGVLLLTGVLRLERPFRLRVVV